MIKTKLVKYLKNRIKELESVKDHDPALNAKDRIEELNSILVLIEDGRFV